MSWIWVISMMISPSKCFPLLLLLLPDSFESIAWKTRGIARTEVFIWARRARITRTQKLLRSLYCSRYSTRSDECDCPNGEGLTRIESPRHGSLCNSKCHRTKLAISLRREVCQGESRWEEWLGRGGFGECSAWTCDSLSQRQMPTNHCYCCYSCYGCSLIWSPTALASRLGTAGGPRNAMMRTRMTSISLQVSEATIGLSTCCSSLEGCVLLISARMAAREWILARNRSCSWRRSWVKMKREMLTCLSVQNQTLLKTIKSRKNFWGITNDLSNQHPFKTRSISKWEIQLIELPFLPDVLTSCLLLIQSFFSHLSFRMQITSNKDKSQSHQNR